MIQIAALNDSSSDESDTELQYENTKEAQESNAFALYNKALGLQRTGNHFDAERVFNELLNTHLLIKTEPPEDPEKPGSLVQPGLILKYSTYKNLGSIAFQRHDLNKAMEHYLEAASLDSTDVTLWFKIGTVAVELYHLPLARVAFQQGLTCNPKHWPCLDQICTVLYALNDYATCLYYICKALERDHSYTKGLALRDQIFSEQPSFRRDSYHMFRHCDDSIHNARVKQEAADKIIKEALTLRDKKRALQEKPKSPVLKFLTPLKKFTWKDVGERLISLYDHISERTPKLSFGCTIDISESLQSTPTSDEDCQMEVDPKPDDTATPSIPQDTLPSAETLEAGGTQPFTVTESESEVVEEKSSKETDAATNVPGQSQDQEQSGNDGDQEVPISYDVEKGQEDAALNQVTHDQQQQDDQQEQQEQQQDNQEEGQQGAEPVSASGEPPALDYDTPTLLDESYPKDQAVPMDTEETAMAKQKKRGPKRKRERIEIEEPFKRRSARVRNTTKKKEETVSVNYAELLQRFLPSSLTDSETEEDGMSQDGMTNQDETPTDNAAAVQEAQANLVEHDSTEFVKTEEGEVRQFLEDHEDNSGVLDILHYYLVSLARKYQLKWPSKLTDVYVKGFERLRKHCCFPEIFSSDASDDYRVGVGEMLLVYAELKLDQWLIARGKMAAQGTPKKASSSGPPDCLADFPGEFFVDDMGYVEDLSRLPPLLGEDWKTFAIRANWMKSRFLILQGKPEVSIDFFEECAYFLTSEMVDDNNSKTSLTVTLPNCVKDNIVTNDKIKEQKKSLERCQSLEEVQRLHESEDYKRVIHLLLPTVLQPSMAVSGKVMSETATVLPERRAQLELLTQALVKLEDYSQCITCGAASLGEAWQELVTAKTGSAREEWTGLLIQILESLDKAMSQGISVLVSVERSRLVQLTTILINIIEHAMEGAEMDSMQALTTVLPWIVLYRLIKLQEDKLTAMRISTGSPARSGSPVPLMPSSLMLLETAHEYLGRHSWCNNSEGALLKLYVSVLEKETEKVLEADSHPFKEDLQMAVEQCFYCLYAHPLKRSRARHLQDHRVEEVPLKWEAAAFLFNHFKPKLVPEFDSYKANSMPSDLESLFLKIVKIIPEEVSEADNTIDLVQAYMDGTSETAPSIPAEKETNRPVLSEVYYFLADFYFKNKEFGKAIRFYNLDICVCPNRLDSWAGVALARGGRLDLKINSCDSKTESSIYKNSVSALRCFKRALEIDKTNLALWIEYGSLAYTLHSHASRQLKQDVHPRLPDDTIQLLRDKRKEMLELAGHCFLKARECEGDGDGEEWLVEYMLGKVSEKQCTEPGVYLKHYLEAANHLYENEAKYPKKIAYHNPPDLSLEALEMYYRLHASILKLLKRKTKDSEVDYGFLNEFVIKACDTPFVKAKEKQNTAATDHSDISSNEVDSDGKSSSGQRSRLSSSGTPLSPAYMTPQDHDYARKKKSKKRNISLEAVSTETASEGEILSGDDTTNSSFGQSSGTAQLLKSLAELKRKELATGTPADTSTSEGLPTETESSQDESPCRGSRVKVREEDEDMKSETETPLLDVKKIQDGDAQVGSKISGTESRDAPRSSAPVPVALVRVNPEEPADSDIAAKSLQDQDQPQSEISESEPEIIDLLSDSDSPAVSKPQSPVVSKPQKIVKRKTGEKKKKIEEKKKKTEEKKKVGNEGDQKVKKKEVPATSDKKETGDVSFIDLTVDSSDSDGVTSTPPRRALHESPIRAKVPSKDVSRKLLEDSGAKLTGSEAGDGEAMVVDGASIAEKEKSEAKDSSKEAEPMEVDTNKDKTSTTKDADKDDSSKTSKPAAETATSTDSSKTSKPATESSTDCERTRLINRCISALGLCLSRFPQHYKSLYRLAQVHCLFDTHKNIQWSRDLLLGTSSSWQNEDHMPSPALFGEHNKTKNLFQGIWRIPITEIDRSGSFPWHMYRSMLLLLEVLENLQDHQMLMQVAIKLSKNPEQGKKYLRDTDRQYLSQQSYQLCLAVLQQQLSEAKDAQDVDKKLAALLAAHKVWQCVSNGKFVAEAGVPANILKEAYKAYKGTQVETEPSVLEQAVRFCMYYKLVNKLPQTPTSQQADLLFTGRSPRDSWFGSPVRGNQSEARFQFTSPGAHDNRTTPEFTTTAPPKKTATSGGWSSDRGMSPDSGAAGRKSGVMFASSSGQYSSATIDYQSAYRESLLHKARESAKLAESKAVKQRLGSPTSMQTHSKLGTGATHPQSSAQPSFTSQQKSSGGAKISSVTGKPIVKLRTKTSMGLKVKPAGASQTTLTSQSKYFDVSSKGHHPQPLERTSPEKHTQKMYSGVHTSSLSTSSTHVAHRVVPSVQRVAPPVQHATQSQPPMTTASASVVQKLREALGSKQVAKEKTFTSKLSLHKDHPKHGDVSVGSRGNMPVSGVSQQPPPAGGQSNPPGSFGGQRSFNPSKKDDDKSNFMSSFLSFIGGSSK